MKITRQRALEIYTALEKLANCATGVKLSYAIAKSRVKLRTEVEAIKTATKPSINFIHYEERRLALCTTHAAKDEHDRPCIVNGNFVLKDQIAFETELKPLREEYAQVIADREKQLAETEALLNAEVDVDLHVIQAADLEAGLQATENLAMFLEPLLGCVIVE